MDQPTAPSGRVPRSMQLYARAQQLIPGGTQLISRRPTRFACGVSPVYAVRAKAARFWDVDGHEYIDWTSGIGSILLGYCDPVVDEAVREQLALGSIYSVNHELELELAEELCRMFPCAEMVRYARCGGEACAMAIRIARGVTGRDRVLVCGYHGWHDWYLAANLEGEEALAAHLFSGIEPIGVPRALRGTAIPFVYGSLSELQALLASHRGEVAAVIMEPLRSRLPPPEYLPQVAAMVRDAGALLIFDEVSTGLRYGLAGAQGLVGVVPDMAVLAKSLSNGYAMAAVVGQRWCMEAAAHMFISSTYWSETLGLRAALTTLREARQRNLPAQLASRGTELMQRLNRAAAASDMPVRCEGVPFHPQLVFEAPPNQQRLLATLFIQEMAKRGCHGYTSFCMNGAQQHPELEQTERAATEVFSVMAEAMRQHRLEQLLECELREEPFRRLVT